MLDRLLTNQQPGIVVKIWMDNKNNEIKQEMKN